MPVTCPVCGRTFRSNVHVVRVARALASRGYIVELNSASHLYASPLLPGRTFPSLHSALAALAEAGLVGPEVCRPSTRRLGDPSIAEKLAHILAAERGRVATVALRELLGNRRPLHPTLYTPERLAKLLPSELDGWRLVSVERRSRGWMAVYARH